MSIFKFNIFNYLIELEIANSGLAGFIWCCSILFGSFCRSGFYLKHTKTSKLPLSTRPKAQLERRVLKRRRRRLCKSKFQEQRSRGVQIPGEIRRVIACP